MLEFKPLTIVDKDWMSAYYRKKDVSAAQFSFAANYVWRLAYPMAVSEEDGFFFAKVQIKEGYSFLCPIGDGNLDEAIGKIEEYCRENGLPVRLHGILEPDKEKLEQVYGTRMVFKSNRDDAEYVYEREALANLSGKRYHGKRNHIKRFMDNDWGYEPITEQNIEECVSMQREWCRQNGCASDDDKIDEGCAVMLALRNFFKLGFKGGLLRQKGKVVAFTIGEPVGNSTFAVHFEKAFSEIQGAYPAINQLFVQSEMEGFRYVNREEDTGSEGLRKAKLSYHPAFLLEKYTAELIG